ncbi:hypothetical protein XELAEV_18004075mg [Xenopus laevis]|uniref:Uncharacterized protein n=1 Tax=Xenopus laevis TaxID=8355 RepID=A0A974BNF3_XENLA|nr:hypothetical protein XELAEV_18004075mg [Xenopus laevis]
MFLLIAFLIRYSKALRHGKKGYTTNFYSSNVSSYFFQSEAVSRDMLLLSFPCGSFQHQMLGKLWCCPC